MDFIPTGPRGPNRPHQPTSRSPDQESIQEVPVGEKQIPPWQPVERKSLDEWKIDPFNATPVIARPSGNAEQEYQGSDVKERVLAMLGEMDPDINESSVRRVSSERRQEMAERVVNVQKVLEKESIQKALNSGTLLLDLDDQLPAVDITLNYVMALALKLQRTQDDIRAAINADRGNVKAWMKGLKQFSQLQDAWRELHPIVTDICSHEPLAFEPLHIPLTRTDSQESDDSGVGDLMNFDEPWDQPQPLVSPEPISLPPAAEARISQLERQLGDTLEHLRHERTMSDRLQESQEKVAALTHDNQQLAHQYAMVQKEVEALRKQPAGAGPEALRWAEQQLSHPSHESLELIHQLEREKETLREEYQSLVESKELLESQNETDRYLHKKAMTELTERVSLAEQERNQLKIELDESRQREKLLNDNVKRLEQERTDIDSRVAQLTEENKKLCEDGQYVLKEKDSRISVLQQSINERQRERDETVSERDSRIHEMQTQLDKFTQKAEEERDDFARELADFDENGRAQFVTKLEEIEKLKQQLEEAETEYQRKKLKAESLHEEQLNARDKTEESLRQEISQRKEKEIEEKERAEQFKKDLDEKVRELAGLKRYSEEEKRELLEKYQEERRSKETTLDDLKMKLAAFEESAVADAESEKIKYEAELLSRNEEIQSLTVENQSLSSRVKESVPKEDLETEQKLKNEAEERASQALSLVNSLNSKVEVVERELEEQKKLVTDFKEKEVRLEELEIASTEFDTKIEELTRNKTLAEEQLVSEREETERLKVVLEEKETAHNLALRKEQDKLKESEESLTANFNARMLLETQRTSRAEEALELEKEKDRLHQQESDRLQDGLKEERAELQSTVSSLQQRLQQLEQEKKNELERLQSEFDKEKVKLTQAHQKALAEEQLKVSGLETDAQTTAEEVEKEITRQLEKHQKELSMLEQAYEKQLSNEKEEFEHLLEETRSELNQMHLIELDTERQKAVASEEAVKNAEKEKEELLRQHRTELDNADETHQRQLRDKEKEFNAGLEERRTESERVLRETTDHLAEEYQRKLLEEKRPLEEERLRLETALSEEKKKITAKEQDLSTERESLRSLTEERDSLQKKLQTIEKQQVTDRKLAHDTQQKLRAALSDLDKDKKRVDQELTDIQLKLRESEEQQDKDKTGAAKIQKELRKRLTELTEEKEAVDDEAARLKVTLSEHEESLQQKKQSIKGLEKERNNFASKVSQLKTELEVIEERKRTSSSVAIQTIPEADVRVQEFINALGRPNSRHDFTSGYYSEYTDTDLSDVDSVAIHSETLYRRPGSKGKGKELRLESMLENSLRRLKELSSTSGNPTPVDIAFQLALKGIDTQVRELDGDLKRLEENESMLGNPNEPPSHSPLRQARIKRYEQFVGELEALHEKFWVHVKEDKEHDRFRAQELSEAMDGHIGMVKFSVGFQKDKDRNFHDLKDKYSRLPQSEVETPEGRVQDIHISLQEVMKHDNAEVRDYVAGAYVKKAAAEILKSGRETVEQAEGDDVRRELVRFEACLRRLTAKSLPLNMWLKLGSMGIQYMDKVVDNAVAELQKGYETDPLTPDDENSVRGESGQTLAKLMIEDPHIRPAVLTLLTSLQETHEGVATGINYYSAVVVGLKRIRDEFGLIDTPTMEELLNYVVHDLKSPNSLLATEAQKRHGQTAVDKKGQLRKDKMLHLCTAYLEKERSPEAPEHSLVRGQSHENGVIVVHPHRDVLDCFKEGGQIFSVEHTRSPQTKGRLQVRELGGANGGLLNTFFERAPGGATQVTNDRANLQCIQISSPDTQPEDIVFKYNTQAKCWQVNLGNALWNVDPAFNLDNPNFKIPFEGKVSGVTHRDWIPLKSLSGETAILALRKVPKHGRYFLYQKGHGNTLVPKVIDSRNPKLEKMEAQFFYDVAMASAKKEDVPASGRSQVVNDVSRLKGAAPCWLNKELSERQLQTLHDQTSLKVSKKPVRCPVPVLDVTPKLSVMTLEDSLYRQIQKKKQSKAAGAPGSDIKPDHTGSKLAPYSSELFGQFSVDANFELIGEHYIEQCRKNLKGSDALLKEEVLAKEKFRREAFKELTVYKRM